MERVEIRDAVLYRGDCLEILPTLGKVDAVVDKMVGKEKIYVLTDPPYGIAADAAAAKNKGRWGWKFYGDTNWDAVRPPGEIFRAMLACSREQIIWGGNYFTDYLPPTMQWLVWDKGQRDFSLADCEFAWSSQNKASRIFDYPRALSLQDGKEHPTQKPIEVMKWCLGFLPKNGTFDIACRRIEEAYKQPDMFIEPPAKPKQEAML